MCNKAADASLECYKDQEMIVTFIYIFPFLIDSIPDKCKSQKMCDKILR